MGRNVGRAVSVHTYDIVSIFAMRNPPTCILGVNRQIRQVLHTKILLPDFNNLRVNLKAIDFRLRIDHVSLTSGGSSRQPKDRNPINRDLFSRWRVEIRCDQHLWPRPSIEKLCRVVNRMNTLTFVEAQIAICINLQHLDVVICRFGFINHPRGCLYRALQAKKG